MSIYSMKTKCQLMAETAVHNHTAHYHGAINLKQNGGTQYLDNYKGRKGFFMKKFLINDKFNLNNWKVTWDAMQKDIWDFIGAPVVLTPDLDHPAVRDQEDYRVGTIIDVGLDEINHIAWQVSEIFDKKAQEMITNGEVEFGSPTVLIRSESTREQKFRGTPQQEDILHRFIPAHDALVANPAYGKQVNNIPAVCTGDGPACALKLLEVSASVQYRAHYSNLEFFGKVKPRFDTAQTYEEAEYVETAIPRQCNTCIYFENPNICHLPMAKPVHPTKGCCRRWNPGKKDEGDIMYLAEVNSDNTDQLTIVPFVRKVLKQRFSDSQLANVIHNAKVWQGSDAQVREIIHREHQLLDQNIPEDKVHEMLKQEFAKKADADSCVSRKIKIIANEHPSMPHDQVIAIAYSYCRGKSKEASMEGAFIAELADIIIPLTAAADEGYWFTTDTGVHIHAGPGESKEDATKRFFKDKPQTETKEKDWKDMNNLERLQHLKKNEKNPENQKLLDKLIEKEKKPHVVPGKVWKNEKIVVSKTPTKEHMITGATVAKNYPGMSVTFAIEQARKADEIRAKSEKPLADMLQEVSKDHPDTEVTGRLKDRSQMVDKLGRKPDEYKDVDQLEDVAGLRLVSDKDINDVKGLVKNLKSKYNVVKEDDYLDTPKKGYRSYHLTVKDKSSGTISEVQVRTRNQDRWATFAHDKVYKMSDEHRLQWSKNIESINAYMNEMSNYYYKLDTNVKNVTKPKCPPSVQNTIGCMDHE